METSNFWKIQDTASNTVVLTYVPQEYGIERLVKKLEPIFGQSSCSCQKFDDSIDKIEDFDTILRVNYNISGTRLVSATLFEYDKEKGTLTIDRQQTRKVVTDYEYTYSFLRTMLRAVGGWDGFRTHLCRWQNFAVNEFSFLSTTPLVELDPFKSETA